MAGRSGKKDGGQGVSVDQKKTCPSGNIFLPQNYRLCMGWAQGSQQYVKYSVAYFILQRFSRN